MSTPTTPCLVRALTPGRPHRDRTATGGTPLQALQIGAGRIFGAHRIVSREVRFESAHGAVLAVTVREDDGDAVTLTPWRVFAFVLTDRAMPVEVQHG